MRDQTVAVIKRLKKSKKRRRPTISEMHKCNLYFGPVYMLCKGVGALGGVSYGSPQVGSGSENPAGSRADKV